jgi:dUTPase
VFQQFSSAVETGLSNKYISPNRIKEMVRDICTNVRNIASINPRINEREKVAQMVVEKFYIPRRPTNWRTLKSMGKIAFC